jgi:Ca2+-binding EF-hand superfamily protein
MRTALSVPSLGSKDSKRSGHGGRPGAPTLSKGSSPSDLRGSKNPSQGSGRSVRIDPASSKENPTFNSYDDEETPQIEQKPSKDSPLGEASRLARKYHLDLYEIKYILKCFIEADENGSGGLDKEEFEMVVRKLFEVPASAAVDPQLLDKAWEKLSGGSTASTIEASPEVFVEWYTQNMFTPMVTNTMNAGDPSANESYELAKKHNITPPQVDKIKKRFNEFDIDRGGTIDYEEFMQMLCFVLKAKSVEDVSEDRASRFWQEIDIDGSGEVDFPEFVAWFVKYFNPDEEEMDMTRGPVGKFYDSFNPRKAMARNSKD